MTRQTHTTTDRRGKLDPIQLLFSLIIILAIAAILFTIMSQTGKNASNNLKNLQSCDGFLGALAGEEGYCHDDRTCGGKEPPPGKEWQPVGKWGCGDKHCCILRDISGLPLTIGEIAGALCEAREPGTITYVRHEGENIGCITADSNNPSKATAQIPAHEPFTLRYFCEPGEKLAQVEVNYYKNQRLIYDYKSSELLSTTVECTGSYVDIPVPAPLSVVEDGKFLEANIIVTLSSIDTGEYNQEKFMLVAPKQIRCNLVKTNRARNYDSNGRATRTMACSDVVLPPTCVVRVETDIDGFTDGNEPKVMTSWICNQETENSCQQTVVHTANRINAEDLPECK
ncbi:MAG: hypothetical protein OXR66_06030 [Candidatus Woesearchaeota archaeon]|nr:hypothetical protein [Candidatus Woesearchaeota archaeon]